MSQENLHHLWFPVGGGQHQGSVLGGVGQRGGGGGGGGGTNNYDITRYKSEEMAANKVWKV